MKTNKNQINQVTQQSKAITNIINKWFSGNSYLFILMAFGLAITTSCEKDNFIDEAPENGTEISTSPTGPDSEIPSLPDYERTKTAPTIIMESNVLHKSINADEDGVMKRDSLSGVESDREDGPLTEEPDQEDIEVEVDSNPIGSDKDDKPPKEEEDSNGESDVLSDVESEKEDKPVTEEEDQQDNTTPGNNDEVKPDKNDKPIAEEENDNASF